MDRLDQISDGPDLRDEVHRKRDAVFVLDLHDQIEDSHGIDLQIGCDVCLPRDGDPTGVEGREHCAHPCEHGVVVGIWWRHRSAHLVRSEEHTSELQSLMRISYAVFCLKKNNINTHTNLTY